MTGEMDLAAREITEVVPLVMRTLALEMRSTGHLPEPAHLRLLLLLAERPHCLSELAEKQAVSLPTMSNSISTLVERGLVARSRTSHDRRKVLVELMPAGRQILEEMRLALEGRVARKLSCLSPADCQRLVQGLEMLRGCFARIPGSERPPR
jgi:DNA-binding MarR family transcriptional regulator